MAQIVYTNIDRIESLPTARWAIGDQESYERTQSMAFRTYDQGIGIVGRQDSSGRVQVAYARTSYTGWIPVNAWHVELARFFGAELDQRAPTSDQILRHFIESIDDPDALNAVQQLVGVNVGINANPDDLHDAVNQIGAALRALGVPPGEWTFLPMLAAVNKETAL